MKGERMTCPVCERQVGFYQVRVPGASGQRIRKPVRHKRWKVDQEPPRNWCPGGERR